MPGPFCFLRPVPLKCRPDYCIWWREGSEEFEGKCELTWFALLLRHPDGGLLFFNLCWRRQRVCLLRGHPLVDPGR
jgi:hypothetical protein